MIRNKTDLKYYIMCDLKSCGMYPLSLSNIVGGILCPQGWTLQIRLRELEYMMNCKKRSIFFRIFNKRFERYCVKLGCYITPNVFGPGLCLNHCNGVVVSGNARIGSNARLNAGVNIGEFQRFNVESTGSNAPIIGNNVYIGPGAKIFGSCHIGDNVAIGANAVVNKNVPDGCTAVGVPARIISDKGSYDLVKYGDEEVIPIIE